MVFLLLVLHFLRGREKEGRETAKPGPPSTRRERVHTLDAPEDTAGVETLDGRLGGLQVIDREGREVADVDLAPQGRRGLALLPPLRAHPPREIQPEHARADDVPHRRVPRDSEAGVPPRSAQPSSATRETLSFSII